MQQYAVVSISYLYKGGYMKRNGLVDFVEQGTSVVRKFLAESDSSSCHASTYDDWNDNDVVRHIVGWMDYSIDKLTCIKSGKRQGEEFSQAISLDGINELIYNKTRSLSREEIESSYLNSVGSYIKVISLYSNDDINLKTFETGFDMELWRYMLMDTVIHPIQHVIYQYLKHAMYSKVVDVIMASVMIFEEYSGGKSGYKLSEFKIERDEYQKKLEELRIMSGTNKDVIDFINVNGITCRSMPESK